MLSLVKQDYRISDLQEGLLCLKRVEYNQDKPRAGDAPVEGFSGFVAGQMESSAARASAMEHPTRRESPTDTAGSPPAPLTAQGTNELVTEFITEFHAVPYGKKCQPLFILLLISALFSPI